MGIWAGATCAAALLALTIWQTWPVPGDDIAQPADPASVAAARVPAPSPVPASPGTADAASRRAAESSSPDAAGGTTPAAADPNLETMRADYEQKLSAQPKDPVLLNKLGEVLERMGQVDEAAACFARAGALQPLEATYRINLARAAGQLGQMQRSIDQYREAARLRPRDYEVVNALGLALQKKGDDEAAVAEFTKARRADPAAPGAVLGLATSLEKLGRVDEAIDVFHQYLDLPASPAETAKVKEHLTLLSRGRSQVK
jgi:Flp pilus assembly protein TadD